jgi:endonuclease/exonuclease/phosphatase family metal-dependent hydrolase
MIKAMTFNIRYGSANDGENHWEKRKSLVIDRIQAFSPDLIGLQECRDDAQAKFIRRNLPEYHFYGVRREGGHETALEMASVLVRKNSFKISRKGCFWLSETPNVPGNKSWDSVFPRIVTWIEAVQRISGRTIVYANTHFDYMPLAIEESARLLADWAEQIARQYPLIVTGDFNTNKDSTAYQRLVGGMLEDVFRQAHPEASHEGTFHNYGQLNNEATIDWILASKHFKVISAEVDRYHEEGLYPSDHYPLTGELDWKE